MKPEEIEQKSFEIITQELQGTLLPAGYENLIKRVIHTTADFGYASRLIFSQGARQSALNALTAGCHLITDTTMAASGINKRALNALGCTLHCFIGDQDVAEEARRRGVTRSAVSMEKGARLSGEKIFVVGNAPTALLALCDLIEAGLAPALIIGVPVGFVQVVESKEELITKPVPWMVSRGRHGGSNVAAAMVNALLYELYER